MSPTPANPARADLADAIVDNWPDSALGWMAYEQRYELTESVLDALLASPEALRWLGSYVEPEQLGYERSDNTCEYTRDFGGGWIPTPVYLAPREETE